MSKIMALTALEIRDKFIEKQKNLDCFLKTPQSKETNGIFRFSTKAGGETKIFEEPDVELLESIKRLIDTYGDNEIEPISGIIAGKWKIDLNDRIKRLTSDKDRKVIEENIKTVTSLMKDTDKLKDLENSI